jgi:cohesin complex subunit SCC1
MTEDQLAVSRNAITLQGEGLDLDLLPDMNWYVELDKKKVDDVQNSDISTFRNMDFDQPQPQGQQHVARKADITLASADDLQFDLEDPGYGFDFGGIDGIGSQDFEIDLGLDFGDGAKENDTISVEYGRDAPNVNDSRGDEINSMLRLGGGSDKDGDERMSMGGGFTGDHMDGIDFDMNPIDLGIDFGDGDGAINTDRERTPGQARSACKISSFFYMSSLAPDRDNVLAEPLTPPPPTPPAEGFGESFPTPTPRTAARVGKLALQQERSASTKKKNQAKAQIIDTVTELENGPGAKPGANGAKAVDVSDILTEVR